MTQLALDLAPLTEPDYADHLTLADRFAEFDRSNPHVFTALEALAAQWLATNPRVGVKALMERLRWESGIQTTGSAWRLNNSWASFYARRLLDAHPSWVGRIQLREQKAAAA